MSPRATPAGPLERGNSIDLSGANLPDLRPEPVQRALTYSEAADALFLIDVGRPAAWWLAYGGGVPSFDPNADPPVGLAVLDAGRDGQWMTVLVRPAAAEAIALADARLWARRWLSDGQILVELGETSTQVAGRTLAGGDYLLDSNQRTLELVEPALAGEPFRRVVLEVDGGVFAAVGVRQGPRQQLMFEPSNGNPVEITSDVWSTSASPDGRFLAVSESGERLLIVETATGEVIEAVSGSLGPGSWSHNGTHLAVVEPDGVRVLAVARGHVSALTVDPLAGSPVGWTADGALLVFHQSCETGFWVDRVDIQTGERSRVPVEGRSIVTVAPSPDGRWIATSAIDHPLGIYDARTGESLKLPEFEGSELPVFSFAWSPDSRWLTASHSGGTGFCLT